MRLLPGLFLILLAQAILTVAAVACALLIGLAGTRTGLDPALAIRLARDQSMVVIGALGIALIVLIVTAIIVAMRWSRPQRALFEASRAVAQGDREGEFVETGAHETRGTMRNLGRIARSFDRLETARRTWLVSVSEELRVPIQGLARQLDEIADRSEPPSPDEFYKVGDGVRRLAALADDLHAVALADLGRLPVTFSQVDPVALIHNAIWACSRSAAAQKVTLEPGRLPPATVLVKWDGPRIEQLFGALIENSLRYTPAKGRITIGLEAQRGAWRLIIDDSAPGIDVELAQRLFEPFYRTTASSEESVMSSGLGLATAQAIVEAHHGRIGASPSPLGGLRVTVILPAAPPTA